MTALKKRIKALEMHHTGTLLFPNFLLSGLPEPYHSFHSTGKMGEYCTMNEAFNAILSGTIYELIQTKYTEYEKTIKPG